MANELLQCPNCQSNNKNEILGRNTGVGELTILRYQHGTTIIRAENFELVCGCGFIYKFQEGTVVGIINEYKPKHNSNG